MASRIHPASALRTTTSGSIRAARTFASEIKAGLDRLMRHTETSINQENELKKLVVMFSVGVSVLVLSGCAVTKPHLSMVQYGQAAAEEFEVEQCGVSGRMALETVALGKTFIRQTLSRYQYDVGMLNESFRNAQRGASTPSYETCNKHAIKILAIKQQQASAQATRTNQAAESSSFNFPKQTICNRIGTQTFCTSY